MASLSGRGLEGDGVTEAKLRLLEARLTGGGRGETVPVTTVVTNVSDTQPQQRQAGSPLPEAADSLASLGASELLPHGPAEVDTSLDSEPSDEEEKAEGRERMGVGAGGGSLGGWGIHSVGGNTSKRMRVRPLGADGCSRSESQNGRSLDGTGSRQPATSSRKRKGRKGAQASDPQTTPPQLSDATNRPLGRSTSLTGARGQNTINRYFQALGDSSSLDSQSLGTGTARDKLATTSAHAIGLSPSILRAEVPCQTEGPPLANFEAERAELLRSAARLKEEKETLSARVEAAEKAASAAEAEAAALRADLEEAQSAAAAREEAVTAALQRLVAKGADWQRQAADAQLRQEALRLGSIGVERAGALMTEVWVDGPAFTDISRRCQALAEARQQVDALKKSLKNQLPLPDGSARKGVVPISQEEFLTRSEVLKAKLVALKREEDDLQREKERLETVRVKHIREAKRRKDEEDSRFINTAVLNGRYALMDMLGKGGFSEVYRAFDVKALREVAIKVHQLNSSWSEAKKQSYVRHAVREYNIQKGLKNPRVVALTDLFEIDHNTFATVLEVCLGGDLEGHLREHGSLPEKEAKAIVAQILQGLAYLNDPGRRIIHYDLKPANILFDSFGEVKITDFGLSKIVEDGQTQGMELTSQGAGTYWYLPPECFEMSGRPPIISSKVDVWSVGVIFYQMLYGKRPFGHNMSQENIMRENTITNAKQVEFPAKPAVSVEAKDFIRRCLSYQQSARPDVHQAAADVYLKPAR
eukprot:jgi/Tetstr1/456834/TSEL_043508.t1